MPPNAQALLRDVRDAAQLIQDFTAGRSLQDYGANALLHAGVERQFITIGEALSRLEKLDAALAAQITDYRKIIGFRNVLVHGYDTIDDPVVWLVIQRDLPVLKQQVEDLLTRLGPP